jgi:hypothetical protein
MGTCLRQWLYLDHEGIESLHRQISGKQVLERTETTSNSRSSKRTAEAGVALHVARALASAESASGQQFQIFERTAPHDE